MACVFASAILATGILEVQAAWPYNSYVSQPYIQPPVLEITTPRTSSPPAPGYLFLGPRFEQPNGTAALIYDQAGNLIWQSPYGFMSNVDVQMLDNQPVLTYWEGTMLNIGGSPFNNDYPSLTD